MVGSTPPELESDIRRALTHLYDWAYLQQSPLLRALRGGDANPRIGPDAQELRQRLLEAIEKLAPLDALPDQSHPGRRYAALRARYVEQMTTSAAAAYLGMSERQLHRELQAGIRALAAIIARDLMSDSREPARSGIADKAGHLTAELAALDDQWEQTNLCTEVRDVAVLVQGLAQRRKIALCDEIRARGLVVQANRIVLRQVVLALFTWAIRNASDSAIVYSLWQQQHTATLAVDFVPMHDDKHRPMIAEESPVAPSLLETLGAYLRIETVEGRMRCRFDIGLVPSLALLLVDDNLGFHKLVKRYLAGLPYELLSAYDGKSGLELARREMPDIIILDVMMPDRDGWELIHLFRQDSTVSGIPIILCTVLDQQELAQSLDIAGYVSKPLSKSALLGALHALEQARDEDCG